MHWALVMLALDSSGRELGKLLAGLVVVVVLALVLAVWAPVLLIVGTLPTWLVQAAPASPIAAPPIVAPPLPVPRPVPPGANRPTLGPPLPPPTGPAPVDVARAYLGVPYVFGGSDPATGLDCSGLVQLVYRQLGIALPRTAQLQYAATTRVPRDQLQPGDLVFFARTYADPHDWITHVGIYIGDGLQINAPTEGQVVSIQPVFSGFWGAHFDSGGRIHRA